MTTYRGASQVLALLLLCIFGLAFPARATAPRPHHHGIPRDMAEEALGGHPVLLANGLYELTLEDGYRMATHGPDPALEGHGTDLGPGDPERAPVCATGKVMHVLYGHPAFISPDRKPLVEEEIKAHIRRMNAVLNEAALASGGTTADYKVACDTTGEIQVDSFANTTIFPYFTNIVESARQAGFDDPNVDYVIFYDGDFPGICGFGQLWDDTSDSSSNRNNRGGYGVTYESCWYSRTPMHENGHTQGAVQTGAPNEDGTGHCTEHEDIMCYPGPELQCPEVMEFDCGFDTYFDAAPEPGEWLDSHWNIGASYNDYIVFGSGGAETPAPTARRPASPDPTPSPSASSGQGSQNEEVAEPDPADAGVHLGSDLRRPNRHSRFTLRMWLTSCEGHEGSSIELQRKSAGSFETIVKQRLDDRCRASVRLRADFTKAVFRSFWSQQDEDHRDSRSRPLRIRTVRQ